jgi:hypothetical protein
LVASINPFLYPWLNIKTFLRIFETLINGGTCKRV